MFNKRVVSTQKTYTFTYNCMLLSSSVHLILNNSSLIKYLSNYTPILFSTLITLNSTRQNAVKWCGEVLKQ